MVSVEEAYHTVLQKLLTLHNELIPIARANGRVLGEEVRADRAFPPFDRVAMDGIAIDHKAFSERTSFPIEGIAAAGSPQKSLADVNSCLEVMTGAILPAGTDTVIRYEDLEIKDGIASINLDTVIKGVNVHRQGTDAAQDSVLLTPGIRISPAEVALFASVGKAQVSVKRLPKVAVVSGGDELVDVNEIPQPHQIRQSNVYALEAALTQYGCEVKRVHVPDDEPILRLAISGLLDECDAIILSGGVSKGKFDFIPKALEQNGVKKIFHEVKQRPGKPFWFGVSSNGKVVFALPGNPVSTFMCFYKYVKPWLFKSQGFTLPDERAVLIEDYAFAPAITLFLQVAVANVNGVLKASPVPGGGSGDFANLKDVTGFLELPPSKDVFFKGEVYPYISFR